MIFKQADLKKRLNKFLIYAKNMFSPFMIWNTLVWKVMAILFAGLLLILLFSGCSKNQDLKIVHNYWDGKVDCKAKKKQSTLDLWVYKKYKDLDGTDRAYIYKTR